MRKLLTALTLVCALPVNAGSLTPFVALGAYHRLCQKGATDAMICDDRRYGSDTPGTVDIGARLRGCGWWCLQADQVDFLIHHQSSVDCGSLYVVEVNDCAETYTNMLGVRMTWEITSLEVTW